MKRILVLLFSIVILNGCAQSTSFVGPSFTLAKSGSAIQAGNSVVMSYGFKKTFNQVDSNTMISSLTDSDIRECQTIHSSTLSEIFFDTLDEIDCYRDPFSILR
jgi:PBP1b-binding outer membrane lipoprotein LpoB